MNLLEKTQYPAALAVTDGWKGRNWNKIYKELVGNPYLTEDDQNDSSNFIKYKITIPPTLCF